MLPLEMADLEEIAPALQDQTAAEHCWLIDPRSGQLVVWTEDGGIDGRCTRATHTCFRPGMPFSPPGRSGARFEWLVEHALIDSASAGSAVARYPDPDLP